MVMVIKISTSLPPSLSIINGMLRAGGSSSRAHASGVGGPGFNPHYCRTKQNKKSWMMKKTEPKSKAESVKKPFQLQNMLCCVSFLHSARPVHHVSVLFLLRAPLKTFMYVWHPQEEGSLALVKGIPASPTHTHRLLNIVYPMALESRVRPSRSHWKGPQEGFTSATTSWDSLNAVVSD
jgi:hypothetical protein